MKRSVRPSTPADAPAIVALLTEAGLQPNVDPAAPSLEVLATTRRLARTRSYVLTSDSELIAHGAIIPGRSTWRRAGRLVSRVLVLRANHAPERVPTSDAREQQRFLPQHQLPTAPALRAPERTATRRHPEAADSKDAMILQVAPACAGLTDKARRVAAAIIAKVSFRIRPP
jgi:hypothetical protein